MQLYFNKQKVISVVKAHNGEKTLKLLQCYHWNLSSSVTVFSITAEQMY